MPTEAATVKKPKVSVWHAFTQPAAWTMFLLGFSSGLPFLLVAGTLAYWLKEKGIELKDITMIASAGMFYALKFLWAPLLDHWTLPLFGKLGQRRGWLLFAQLCVTAGLVGMAVLTPAQLAPFVGATLVVAFFGATQDIAVDAYRIEIAPVSEQGALVATYALGYRIALIVAGAFALILADHIAWSWVYLLLAVIMLIPIGTTLHMAEPVVQREQPRELGYGSLALIVLTVFACLWRISRPPEEPLMRWLSLALIGLLVLVGAWRARRAAPKNLASALRANIVEPFADFFRRYGWLLAGVTLLFILLFKIPEQATIGGIMSPFYRDMGFSKTQIGTVTKIYGIWIGIAGAFVGGAAVARWGAWRTLGVGMVAIGLSNLLFLWLIDHPGNVPVLTLVISGDNFTQGFFGPPTVAFLSSLVNRQHTATQYALLSSLVNLPGKLLGFFAGGIATATGYGPFFVLTVVSVIPATLLFAWLWPRYSKDKPGGVKESPA